FCYQALQEQAFESRVMYDAEMIGDDAELVQEAVDDYWRQWVARASQDPKKNLLFGLLLDGNADPESLAHKLRNYAGKPYLQILPEEAPSLDNFLSMVDELQTIFNEMQQIWQQEQATLLELLLSDGLNGSKYRRDYLEKWFGQMDGFFESGLTHLQPFDQFSNFTDSALCKNLNKGYNKPPEHRFFKLADQYWTVSKQLSAVTT